MKKILLVFFIILFHTTFSQISTSYKRSEIKISKETTVSPKELPDSYNANLIHLEAPSPNGNSVKSYILQQKIKSRAMFPVKKIARKKSASSAASPSVGQEFGLKRFLTNGTILDLMVGIPNDNTIAVSDSGIALLGVNSFIYAYDLEKDTSIFPSHQITLTSMASGSFPDFYYDPKIIYDRAVDRFILVFLKNTDPASNEIILCFSTTNNPNDNWNVYSLPGNPLNNNRWTDFPAIAMTDNDLFITANLIIPAVSWQIGFDGSIIWQVEKQKGYNGDSSLNTILYSDIRHDGKFVRNLHPIQGADGSVDELYLLSNRNFDLTNDSIFILHVEGTSTDDTTKLKVDAYRSNLNYGMPPNGRQQDTDTLDPTSGLQTNDARVLGAIKIGDNVQFVSNTVNPATGLSAIYHGTISSISDQPIITAEIIGDNTKDYGYPNIAWTGNEECDIETIISFNYTSLTDFPGIAAVYYDNNGNYSNLKTIIAGENFINRLGGTNERWGDYFGLQRHYKKPGTVFSFGYFAKQNNTNSGWCAELISPDTSKMILSVENNHQVASCLQVITVNVSGGIPPYNYLWSNNPTNNTNSTTNICLGDSVEVSVTDSRGCLESKTIYGTALKLGQESTVYPNPFSSQFAIQFNLDADKQINASIYDMKGRLVSDLLQRNAKKGLNELMFSLLPLSAGVYILVIEAEGSEIVNKRIVKQ